MPKQEEIINPIIYLKDKLKGKVVILGVGNPLKGDDGAGSILAARLKGKSSFSVFDAGVSPENYLDKIIKESPEAVIIVDAVDFQGKAGEIRLFPEVEIKTVNLFATHNLSLKLIVDYLKNNLDSDIYLVGIQPKTISMNMVLSEPVKLAMLELERVFANA